MSGLIRLIARLLTLKILIDRLRSGQRKTLQGRPSSERDRPPTQPGPTTDQGRESQQADSPLDLEPRDWKQTIKRTLKEMKEDRVTLAAAGMAYYFFLAIFPALIAVIGVLGLIHADTQGLIESVRSTLPGGTGRVLTDAILRVDRPSEDASLIAAITGIALAVWSASSGMVALQSGLNIVYDVPSDRKFFGKRGIALALILATAGLGGVPSPFFTFGESTIFTVIGWTLTVVAVVIMFSVFYYLAPNRESPQWRWVSTGGVVGAVLWIASSAAFGFYVSNFGSYGKTYGPLAGVVLLILWLYLSSLTVLIGGELNSETERQAAGRAQVR